MKCWLCAIWALAVLLSVQCLADNVVVKRQPIRSASNTISVKCEGGLGLYTITVTQHKARPNLFELTNKSLEVAELALKQRLAKGKPFRALLTRAQLDRFEILALSLHDDNVSFLDRKSLRETFCTLPIPPLPADPNPHVPNVYRPTH
jgi:hypothetical protein